MFARPQRLRRGRYSAVLGASALSVSLLAFQGGGESASATDYDPYVDAPAGEANVPVADDVIINYASGRPVASHYKFSYICPTAPDNDLNPPYNVGNGINQTRDFTEYQSQPCYFGIPQSNPGEAPIPLGEIKTAFHNVRELYGLAPWFEQVPTVAGQLKNLYGANTPLSQIQANCPRQGAPFTTIADPVGTCLMHMSVLDFPKDNGGGDINYHVPVGQVPLPAHSHILGDFVNTETDKGAWGRVSTKESPTSLGPTWWHPRSVLVLDRSIWPDSAGNCPAGREHCLTSIKALREAQAKGQARPEGGSNILLYFSVQPISQQGQAELEKYSLNNADGSVNAAGRARWEAILKQRAAQQADLARSKALIRKVGEATRQDSLPTRRGSAPVDTSPAVRNEKAATREAS